MYFDHEKRIVHQKSMEYVAFAAALLSQLQSPTGKARLFPVVKVLSEMTKCPEVAGVEMARFGDRMRLGMDNKSKSKSKSKNLDCGYVCDKAGRAGRS